MAELNISEKEKKLLIKVGIFVVAIYGAVWGSEFYSAKYTAEVRSQNSEWNNELNDYRARLAAINEEEILQSQFVEAYNLYRDRNLIIGSEVVADEELSSTLDEEQRLFLLERLRQVQNERKFFAADYELVSPENLPATFSALTDGSNVAVRANKMTVKLPLLHSLDMLMLLNDFHDNETNNFTTVHCGMKFTGGARNSESNQASLLELRENIDAYCDLVWLSVYDPQYGVAADTTGGAG